MTLRILYVEDNFNNIQLVQRSLAKIFGGQVDFHFAQDGHDGIEAALKLQPHLIIMDLHMPGMDGMTAIKHLNENVMTQAIPVIILTADVVSDIVRQARRAGVAGVLSKPISMRSLQRTIGQVLDLQDISAS